MEPVMEAPRYWIAAVAQEIAVKGIAGGFAEVGFGKAGPLERMRAGDGFAVYSPRTAAPEGLPLQAFTAIGRVRTGVVFRAEGGAGPGPFRVEVDYFPAAPAPIRPLVESLTFIRNKAHWGAAFRFGFVKVPPDDFALIAAAMGCKLTVPEPQPG
jgi:hypothetical protein